MIDKHKLWEGWDENAILPTREEIENDDYSTAQVANMRILIDVCQHEKYCMAALAGITATSKPPKQG